VKLPLPIQHVIFDLDGVLLDTEPAYTAVTQGIVAAYGKVFDWSVKRNMVGRPAIDSARYLVQALDLPITPEAYLATRAEQLAALLRRAEPMPGAQAITRALADHRVPMAIATSTDSRMWSVKSEAHRPWLEVFTVVVCGDDPRVTRGKPAPDIFLAAAEDLRARPETCVVFEDSPFGVEAARAAGMQVIALPDPHMDRACYSNAQWVIDSLVDCRLADLGL